MALRGTKRPTPISRKQKWYWPWATRSLAFKPDLYAGKQLIHINIDPAEIDKVYPADVRVVSDIKPALQGILSRLSTMEISKPVIPVLPTGRYYDEPEHRDAKRIFPGDMIRLLSDNLPENAIVMGDAGSHMLWANCYLRLSGNQRYQNPGSFGPMASHTNGCIGVKCANPDKAVIACVGDGCYQMAGFELMTAVQYNIPVIWIIFNNHEFNIIKKFLLNMYNDEAFMDFEEPGFREICRSLWRQRLPGGAAGRVRTGFAGCLEARETLSHRRAGGQ